MTQGPSRLARSLELLRTVNAWRLRAARYPTHVRLELAYREEQLREHDAAAAAAAAELRAIDNRDHPRQIRMPWR